MSVGEHCAVVEDAGESGFVVGSEAKQVIVAELVDHDGEDKFRFSWGLRLSSEGRDGREK